MSAGPASREIFERALRVLPGGVNSPVRAFRAVGGTPIVIEKAQGVEVTSVDGRTYLDFVGSWGPLILGHAHPEVVEAVRSAARHGTTYGAPCPAEVELAERIVGAYPGIDQIRCVSSGTEATMSAVRLARGATGRDRVLKFAGSYHGHVDHLMVSAGSGLVTFGQPSSAGVPAAVVRETRVLPLDDDGALARFFDAEGDQLAAVILEPIPANNGLLKQRPEFLRELRQLTEKHGALLIFDEVITGFRVGAGGAAELYGITPDIACFGKVIGGGLPVGAFGARRELMAHLAPDGGVYQAGTLSGNPLAMAAGVATLDVLLRDGGWECLEGLGQALEVVLAPVLEAAPMPARLVRQGSVFWLCLQEGPPPRRAEEILAEGAELYKRIFHHLLDDGILLAPSMYEVGFLSLAHRQDHLEQLAAALERAFAAEGRPGSAESAG
ncbi:MAG: glutamate-1-semialdehyde 2,1-aminomutase [Holophagales bacterium]|nr:glutamate-1-semialdehyde 2,1-aminomutase [Holophagales bacterium]